jgi:hypothetical protein
MSDVWIESLHNLHCPTCDARLVEQAGKFEPLGRPDPVYITDGRSLTCPAGDPLPTDRDALYAYRDAQGHPMEPLSVRETWPPR